MIQKLVILVLISAVSICTKAQGIDFEHGTWAEALSKAQQEDKMIFVDGYATWCGPCKRLSKSIFPLKEVGDYFNANFVNVKMDMEKGEGIKFRKKYPISAFPTLYFIDPNGELVQKSKGAPRTSQSLIDIARTAAKKFDRSASHMTKYEAGDRSYKTMYNLVTTLNKSGKPSLKYANEYLRTQDDLTSEENVKFLFEALTQVDSRIFKDFTAQEKQFAKYYSEDEIHAKVQNAANKTVSNAIEFNFPELLTEAQEKYSSMYPKRADEFETQSNVTYAIAKKDAGLFLASSKKMKDDDYQMLTNAALKSFEDNPKVIKSAEKWAKSLADKNDDADSYYLLAMTQVKLEKVAPAIKSLEKAQKLAEPNSRKWKICEEYLHQLNSKK